MIPELGHFALIIALVIAVVQATFSLAGAATNQTLWMNIARPAARTQFLFLMIAYGCLTWSFAQNDFSVLYVAAHSNSALPLLYRIPAVWGGHEGSMLLWIFIFTGWMFAVSFFSKDLPEAFAARVLGVQALISTGLLLFILFTSNPFERLLPAALDGADLNPVLQDPGLIIHPPMLYMGYVGFSVAFSFAIAALLGGQLDATWARWSRPWTLIAWIFLTLGIALGSWWAYYELGWGGWWFWDPVENASFMPWLVGTALIHSLAVTDQRSAFKSWTVLLAIFAFSLSLLGTFLVRSGVLTSVHAFATDPERGVFILVLLGLVVGSSLLLYTLRAPSIKSSGKFELVSRESALLLNNILLIFGLLVVLIGTLYPLIHSALGYGSISVGKQFFDFMFPIAGMPLAFLLGLGPLARWKKSSLKEILLSSQWNAALSLALGFGVTYFLFSPFNLHAAFGASLGAWVITTTLTQLIRRGKSNRAFWGMTFAHVGVGVFIIGVTFTNSFSVEKDVRMNTTDEVELAGFRFQLSELKKVQGPNYQATQGHVNVYKEEHLVAELFPQKRIYNVQTMPVTEAGIDAGLFRDLFVALGEPIGENTWAVRVYHKPFIRWIWLGCVMMGIGGIIAMSDRRYRVKSKAVQTSELSATDLALDVAK